MTAIDLNNAPLVFLDDSNPNHHAQPSLLFHSPDHIIQADSFDELGTAFHAIDEAVNAGLHVAGWIAYECARHFEPSLEKVITEKAKEPLIWMMATKHRKELSPSDVDIFFHNSARGNTRIANLKKGLPAQTEEEYVTALKAIHDYIVSGDVYQINHTLPIPVRLTGSATGLYQKLRQRQPVSFGAYIDTGEDKILSLSPELFLEKKGDVLTARPMKGTAPRGRTLGEDIEITQTLLDDPKSQAENLMIVDLIRNDLSRISEAGSVKVPNLFDVEQYPTLHQMTSTVTATAKKSLTPYQLLKGMFPCGSVTGAPKVRAIEIIQSLEKSPRGVYCGTIGYFSPKSAAVEESWCLNVPIRTLILDKNGSGRLSVGSGVVADSDPIGEYQECLLKATFIDKDPVDFSLIETMRCEAGHISCRSDHLDRLEASAAYFGFSCKRGSIEAALTEHIDALPTTEPVNRIRLLLDQHGAVTITSAALIDEASSSTTVCVSAVRTSSSDPFLFHKTTNRSLYNAATTAAYKNGYADILFFNEKGHLTEGSISNIFIEKGGTLYTPPLTEGLLPGIFRSNFLKERANVKEKSLIRNDLETADAIFIGNSLRGLRRVSLSANNWNPNTGFISPNSAHPKL